MDSNPLVNPYTHETPANPYLHPWNTLTCTEGKGIDGSGSGSAWEHPGVTHAHHYKFMYNQYIHSKNVKWVQDQDDIQTGVRKTIPKAIQTRATIVMYKIK